MNLELQERTLYMTLLTGNDTFMAMVTDLKITADMCIWNMWSKSLTPWHFSLQLMGREGHTCTYMNCTCEFIECGVSECHIWQCNYDPSLWKMFCCQIQKLKKCRYFLTVGKEIGLFV